MVVTRGKKAAAAQDGVVKEEEPEQPVPKTPTPIKKGKRGRPPKVRNEVSTPSTSAAADVSISVDQDVVSSMTLLTCEESKLKSNEAEACLVQKKVEKPTPSGRRVKKEVISPQKPKHSPIPPPPPLSKRRSTTKLKVKKAAVEKVPEPEPETSEAPLEEETTPIDAPSSPPHPEDPQPSFTAPVEVVKEPEEPKETEKPAVTVKEEPVSDYNDYQSAAELLPSENIKQEPEQASQDSTNDEQPEDNMAQPSDSIKQGEDTVNDMDIADSDSESGDEEAPQPSTSCAPPQHETPPMKEIHVDVEQSFTSKLSGLASWERNDEGQVEQPLTSPVRRPRIHFLHPAYQSFANDQVHVSPQPPPPPPPTEPAPIKETENGFSMGFKPMAFKSKTLKSIPLMKQQSALETTPSSRPNTTIPASPAPAECSSSSKRNSNFGSSASVLPPPKMVDLPKLSFFNMPPTTSSTNSQENDSSSDEPPVVEKRLPTPPRACASIQPAAPKISDAEIYALKAKAERVAQDIARRHHAAEKQKEEREEHDRRREERERRHKKADEERMEQSKHRQREDDERRTRDRELRRKEREEQRKEEDRQRDLERKQKEEESKIREQERKAREEERKAREVKEEEKKMKEEDMKVPPYELITECKFLMKSANKKKTDSMICYCAQTNSNCSDQTCVNRAMQTECPASCPAKCKNQRFAKRKYAAVEAFHTGTAKGCGLRALKDIKKGRFIIEYVGEVVERDDYEKRKSKYALDKKHKHHYLCDTGVYTIDATVYGNPSRFVNHSCDPNAICEKWAVPRTPGDINRVGFFAKRDIKAGEEVTFNYQFVNYGSRRDAQQCFCGAATCTGWIGQKPDQMSSDDENDEDEDPSAPRMINIDDNYDERLEDQLYDLTPSEQIKYLDEEFASFDLQKKKSSRKVLTVASRMTDYQQREQFLRSICSQDISYVSRHHFAKEGISTLIAEWLAADDFSVANLKLVQVCLQSLYMEGISSYWKSDRFVVDTVHRWANIVYDDWFDIHVVADSLVTCVAEPRKKYSDVSEANQTELKNLVQTCNGVASRLSKTCGVLSFKIPKKARDQGQKEEKTQASASSNSNDSGRMSPSYQRHHHSSSNYERDFERDSERDVDWHPQFFNNGNDVHQYRFGGYHGNNYKENYGRRISYRESHRERRRNGRRSRSRSRSLSPQMYKRRKLEERDRNRSPAYDRRGHSPSARSPESSSGERTHIKSEPKMHAMSDASSGSVHMSAPENHGPITPHVAGYPIPHEQPVHAVPPVVPPGYGIPGYETYGMYPDPSGMFMYHPPAGYYPPPYHPHPVPLTMETLPTIEKLDEIYRTANMEQLMNRLENSRRDMELIEDHIVRKRAEEEAAALARRQAEEEDARRLEIINSMKYVWAKAKCENGEIYFYNKVTKETQWSPPTADQGLLDPNDRTSPDTTVIVTEEVKAAVEEAMEELEMKIKEEPMEQQTVAAAVVEEEPIRKPSREKDRERDRDRDRERDHRDRDRDRDRREGSRHKDHSHRHESISRDERRTRDFKSDLEKAIRSVVKSAVRSMRDASHDKTTWLIKMVAKEMYKRESQQPGFDFRFNEITERKVRNYTKSLIERKLKTDDLWKGYSEGR